MANSPHMIESERIMKAFLLAPVIVLAGISILILIYMFTLDLFAHRLQVATYLGIQFFFGIAVLIAYMHELILALPVFLLLKKRRITKIQCLFFGFIVGALPYSLYLFVLMHVEDSHRAHMPSNIALALALALPLIGATIGYCFWRIGIKPRPITP